MFRARFERSAVAPDRELLLFAAALAALVGAFLHESLFLGRALSPADVLFATGCFREIKGPEYEPKNRLLIDPVLQFQPWIEFNRGLLGEGRLPLWNPYVGCGAPHLANGQSAVFDPFLLIDYLGPLPRAFAWTAAARLWFAGLGMFLLMRRWGAGPWGRWFSGLTFPFTGFLVVWLEYPVTSSAVWLPWMLHATERLRERSSPPRVAWLGLTVAGCLLGGHVQTAAHAMLLVGVLAARRAWESGSWRSLLPWSAALTLGILIASIEIVPLGFYLARSPVWTDRAAERTSPLALEAPRLPDTLCAAFPYVYGSQRRGHPNLAKAVGAQNVNEAAGAFAGLAPLIWLAPLAALRWRTRPILGFLALVALFGLSASFRLPPVDNLLRALPVLNVTDNRRLGFWASFAVCALAGFGLDLLTNPPNDRLWRWCSGAWILVGLMFLVPPAAVVRFEPRLRAYALEHYGKAAAETLGADPEIYRERAERRTRETLRFVPRYYSTAAIHLFGLAGILGALRAGTLRPGTARGLLLATTLADLFGFGFGLNPAIPPTDHAPGFELLSELRAEPGARLLALGAELPPNVPMRYGLKDVRNYDSMEVAAAVAWFEPLFTPASGRSRTSRREVDWEGVARALPRLTASCVRFVVSPTPPPASLPIESTRRAGSVHLTRIPAAPPAEPAASRSSPGEFVWEPAAFEGWTGGEIVAREIAVPGWRAWVDGVETPLAAGGDPFLRVRVGSKPNRVVLRYDPPEVRAAAALSVFGLGIGLFALTSPLAIRSTRIVRARLGRNRAAGLRS